MDLSPEEIKAIKTRMQAVVRIHYEEAVAAFRDFPSARHYQTLEDAMLSFQCVMTWPQSSQETLLKLYAETAVGLWNREIVRHVQQHMEEMAISTARSARIVKDK